MFDSMKKKMNLGSDKQSIHAGHDISDDAVETACQILSVYLASQPADGLEVEMRNLSCQHGKIGSFKISVEKI